MLSPAAVAEGVPTAKAAHDLAASLGVECPVLDGIYRVIHGAWPSEYLHRRDLLIGHAPACCCACILPC